MMNRRIAWLLTAAIALGVASGAPIVRVEWHAGGCDIVCIAAERCERQEPIQSSRRLVEEAGPAEFFHYDVPQISRFHWPSSYQRPPTHVSAT